MAHGTDLDAALQAALSTVAQCAQERGVAVLQTGSQTQVVGIPGRRLIRLLGALLIDAIKRAPEEDGVVIVSARDGGRPGSIALTIRDNGERPMDALPVSLRRMAQEDGCDLWSAPEPTGGTKVMLMLQAE